MTPTELLTQAASDFPVMYLDPEAQSRLLQRSLEAYQEKVGPVMRLTFTEDSNVVDTPKAFLSIALAMDAEGVFHEAEEAGGVITVTEQPATTELSSYCGHVSVKPFCIWYFQDFQNWATDQDLPPESIHLISEYLIALLDVLNSERGRAVAQSTGLNLEFPSDQELRERLTQAGLAMEENQAIIPGVVVM
jgi:hypothetical protein